MNFNFTNFKDFKNLKLRRVIGGLLLLAICLGLFAAPVGINLEKSLALAEPGVCRVTYSGRGGNDIPVNDDGGTTGEQKCTTLKNTTGIAGAIFIPASGAPATVPAATSDANKSGFDKLLDDYRCGIFFGRSLLPGCAVQLVYILFVTVPSLVLSFAAKFFDVLAQLTLSPEMYKSPFIGKIWEVVRDFANIFFILILLYAAFSIILNLGHGNGKKIIAAVILIALLVNFSLFFTKIVIDTSNIVALIFYNRINTKGVPQEQIGSEQPLALALTSRFGINDFFNGEIVNQDEAARENNITKIIREDCNGDPSECSEENKTRLLELAGGRPSAFKVIAIMVMYGIMVCALIYAFLVVGLSFLGRLIGLIMLMIISPFAFVTAAVPKFKGIKTIGFDSWLKQLFQISFVAAIFMFIIYIASEILRSDPFAGAFESSSTSEIRKMLMIIIPAVLLVILLLKGAKYAKEASGEITGSIISGAKVLGGAALGGVAGLAAFGGTQVLGRIGTGVASNEKRREVALNADGKYSKWEQMRAKAALGVGSFLGKKSYDVRQVGAAKTLAGKAGIKLADKGLGPLGTKTFEKGRAGQIERRIDKEEEKIKSTVLLTKLGEKNQDERHNQFGEDLLEALKIQEKERGEPLSDTNKAIFGEEFKTAYEKGGNLKEWGLDKEVEEGSIKSAADVNKDRREAYAAALADGGVLKQTMRGLLGGLGKMLPAGAGVAVAGAVAGGAAAGAVGAGALVIGGGILQALKAGFDRLDKSTLQVAAAVRKPPPANKEIEKLLKQIAGSEKVSAEKITDVSKKLSDQGGEKGKGGERGH